MKESMGILAVFILTFAISAVSVGSIQINDKLISRFFEIQVYLVGFMMIFKIFVDIGIIDYLYNKAYRILFKKKSARMDLEIELCEKEKTALKNLNLLIKVCGMYNRTKLRKLAQKIVNDFLVLKINNDFRILVLRSLDSINIVLNSSKGSLYSLMQEKDFCYELEINLNSIGDVIKVLQKVVEAEEDKIKAEMKEFAIGEVKNISSKLDSETTRNNEVVKDLDEIYDTLFARK